ncbi:Flp family type IVb pilin [Knoellia sp. 3-2P3]|uniref:Flp family type IVb pilin n=1 Tax=unclassified Knoellia TaxID=2618719 RepID=UPI0023DA1471|nr:Flp family type IVb pilin [Knoellia sp. 3-2P3]MDF2093094.1 Flp family type IVb pilin [Knoellia sp. 3-2P3]
MFGVPTPIRRRSSRHPAALRSAASSSADVRSRGRLGSCLGDRGATSVEYALMASLIALVIIGAVTAFGLKVIPLFNVPASAL